MTSYRGRVSKVNGTELYVTIADLGVDMDYGPCEVVEGQYSVGDFVLVNQIRGAAEDVVVVGPLKPGMWMPPSVFPANPATDDSFLVSSTGGTRVWKSPTDAKTILGVDAVWGPAKGGTGISSYTTGNYIKATGSTTLAQATPSTMRTDLSVNNTDNTSDANKPVSTAQQTALNLKRDKAPTSFATGQNFNSLTTPGEYIWTAGSGSNTNAPETNPGLLVVNGSSAVELVQSFFAYTSGYTYNRQYNGSVWTSWVRLNYVPPTLYRGYIKTSTVTNFTTTSATDITGATLTTTVASATNVFFIQAVVDASSNAATTGTFAISLDADGGVVSGDVVWVTPASGTRGTVSQQWMLTNIAAGSQTFKLTGLASIANKYSANSNTTLYVEQKA